MLTVGSLFAGIGGIELGLERTGGFKTVWQVEKDEYARRVLEKHWPDARRWDDVCTFPPDTEGDLRGAPRNDGCEPPNGAHHRWYADIVCGGFPCQDISYAGHGAGLSGERSGLFFELIRVVREVEPRFVLLENVSALLTRGMGDVLGTLASIGLDAEWHCIPAAAIGAPHIRDRVFVLAYPQRDRSDARRSERTRQPRRSTPVGTSGNRIDEWWAAEPNVGRVANGVPNRVDRTRSLGNAVVPQVAEWIGYRILEAITDR